MAPGRYGQRVTGGVLAPHAVETIPSEQPIGLGPSALENVGHGNIGTHPAITVKIGIVEELGSIQVRSLQEPPKP